MAMPAAGAVHRLAQIGDGAARRQRQAGDQAQQGRFAGPGAAEQPDDLALLQREFDAVEHQMLAAVGARERLAQTVNVEESWSGWSCSLLIPAGTCVRRSSTAGARTPD